MFIILIAWWQYEQSHLEISFSSFFTRFVSVVVYMFSIFRFM